MSFNTVIHFLSECGSCRGARTGPRADGAVQRGRCDPDGRPRDGIHRQVGVLVEAAQQPEQRRGVLLASPEGVRVAVPPGALFRLS